MKIPVSVIVTTKNEEAKIRTCLEGLNDFAQVVVVDSQSQDRTQEIAAAHGVEVVNFIWNKQYPKKRQWCLEQLNLKHDWIFFVDADEVVTQELVREIRELFEREPQACGYFIKARYIMQGKLLKFGLPNNKLVLFDRREIEFPVIDDLDIPGMGEMEGHYQPVLKSSAQNEQISGLSSFMIHDCLDDTRAWIFRHQKYARWEIGMNKKNAWPADPKPFRNCVKKFLRRNKYRPQIMFFLSYILLGGFLDGKRGLKFAQMKKEYYALIK